MDPYDAFDAYDAFDDFDFPQPLAADDEQVSRLTSELNPQQRAAVESLEGPLLILAGPGSGKTRVVTHRIANLLHHDVPDRQILALTFTNKASNEMWRRVVELTQGKRVWVSTFHRFCTRMLRQHAPLVGLKENFSILDDRDSRGILVESIAGSDIDGMGYRVEQIADSISRAKANGVNYHDFAQLAKNAVDMVAADIYPNYQQALQQANSVDFDDLLLYTVELLRENHELRRVLDERFRYVLVDEYQDTNTAQYLIVRALSIDYPNLAVTGDPDQSIYSWRGANIQNILDFEKDYPTANIVRLEQNYRSTPQIVAASDHLIQYNHNRHPKRLFTDNAPGRPVRLIAYPTHHDEANDIVAQIRAELDAGRPAKEIAVFYRTHAVSRVIESRLHDHGVAYQILNGHEFYQRKEVKDVLAYLHLCNNPANDAACLRIINTPPRGIGRKTLDLIKDFAHRKSTCMLDAARQAALAPGVTKRAAVSVAKFVAIIDSIAEHATQPVASIMDRVVTETGYRDYLQERATDEDDNDRVANIEELLSAGMEFDQTLSAGPALEKFLERAALVSDTDDLDDGSAKVSLMTLHSAKGLEFPVAFLVACEQGYLPHERSQQPAEVEEERRLMFVGMTRAMERLQLSYAMYRMRRGVMAPTVPSPFLQQLPLDQLELSIPRTVKPPPRDEYSQAPPAGGPSTFDDAPREPINEQPAPARKQRIAANFKLTTASEMIDQASGETLQRPDPEIFENGMVVAHPRYGIGSIVSLGGSGKKRTASVRFADESRERQFFLSYCDLKPVASS